MNTDFSAPTLASLVSPFSKEAFLAEALHRRFELMPGSEDRFDGLFGWNDVNRILKYGRLEPPLIRLVRGGGDVPAHRYTVQKRRSYGGEPAYREIVPERLEAELRAGATLVLSHVAQVHPGLCEFARGLERELDATVNINLYAGWRTDNGFAKHWDDHDVFILQLDGRKKWEVYPDTRPKPVKGDPSVERVPTRPVWKGLLTRGDVLYMPRGYWHVAYPVDEPSIHLTVGLGSCTGRTVLSWLDGRLTASDHFRADVPVMSGADGVDAYLALLRDKINDLLGPGAGADFLDWRRQAAPRGLDTALPGSAASSDPPAAPAILEAASARAFFVRDADPPLYVSIRVNGAPRRFPRGVRPMLAFLGGGGRADADRLASLCDASVPEADRRRVVRTLFHQGVLRVVPPEARSDGEPASPRGLPQSPPAHDSPAGTSA